jgi:hypothetical protein
MAAAATLVRQVKRMARDLARLGCGPDCPPVQVVVYCDDWHGTGPSEGPPSGPSACPRCGRPATVQRVEVVGNPHWFNNDAHELAAQAEAGASINGGQS